MVEAEQAYRLKIDSLDGLMAVLATNEDRKRQYSPFECETCTLVTREFNVCWISYYKKFARPFNVIKAGADKLLAMDQPQRPKPPPKRKLDPVGPAKKTTKKSKSEKASTSTKVSKAKASTVPPAPTPPITQTTNPDLLTVQSDASCGTKISEDEQPPPKKRIQKRTKPTPLITESTSSDSTSTQSKRISPISHRPNSPIIDLAKADGKSKPKNKGEGLNESSSDISIGIHIEAGAAKKDKSDPKPTSSHDSGDLLLDLESLVAELHKAASDTLIEKIGHSDSISNLNTEVLDALCWLIDLLSAPIEENVNHDEVQKKTKLITSYFQAHSIPEEDLKLFGKSTSDYNKLKTQLSTEIDSANDKLSRLNQQKTKLEEELASIQRKIKEVEDQKKKLEGPLNCSKQGLSKIDSKLSSVAKQKEETKEQLADIKQAEKDELALHEKFLESQKSTRQALKDILHEYTS
ncbi:hypothetical protein PIB30_021564 [Stylosanthes scabra]|uniref:Uncharacterized protein n=1 Tax=Stylosanthes scabra TaxID=79078 RepID=A0ABU6S9N7_9FABA|nr:hypothetical protein [Stylosanthes scabra]